jgi:hypothetical protein
VFARLCNCGIQLLTQEETFAAREDDDPK